MTVEERASEILLVRQQFLTQHNLKDSFLIEKYFEEIFAHRNGRALPPDMAAIDTFNILP